MIMLLWTRRKQQSEYFCTQDMYHVDCFSNACVSNKLIRYRAKQKADEAEKKRAEEEKAAAE